jgi:ADP-ribose pyrophosphatase YjhB (NUDIX family)
MTKPEVCVGAIAIIDGEILLIKRGTAPELGKWSIPGGHVMNGESLESAVMRELYEETGLEGECKSFIGFSEMISKTSHKVILDFEVAIHGNSRPFPATDAIDAKWVHLHGLDSVEMADGLKNFLENNGYF